MLISCILLGCTLCIGVIGNTLVCLCVYANRTLRTSNNALLVNLAVADLIACVFSVPILLLAFVTKLSSTPPSVPSREVLCTGQMFFHITSSSVQLFTLASISVERYQAIAHPFKTKEQKMRVICSLIISWVAGILLGTLTTVFLRDTPLYLFCRCGSVSANLPAIDIVHVCVMTPLGLICLLITVIFYGKIFRVVRKHVKDKGFLFKRRVSTIPAGNDDKGVPGNGRGIGGRLTAICGWCQSKCRRRNAVGDSSIAVAGDSRKHLTLPPNTTISRNDSTLGITGSISDNPKTVSVQLTQLENLPDPMRGGGKLETNKERGSPTNPSHENSTISSTMGDQQIPQTSTTHDVEINAEDAVNDIQNRRPSDLVCADENVESLTLASVSSHEGHASSSSPAAVRTQSQPMVADCDDFESAKSAPNQLDQPHYEDIESRSELTCVLYTTKNDSEHQTSSSTNEVPNLVSVDNPNKGVKTRKDNVEVLDNDYQQDNNGQLANHDIVDNNDVSDHPNVAFDNTIYTSPKISKHSTSKPQLSSPPTKVPHSPSVAHISQIPTPVENAPATPPMSATSLASKNNSIPVSSEPFRDAISPEMLTPNHSRPPCNDIILSAENLHNSQSPPPTVLAAKTSEQPTSYAPSAATNIIITTVSSKPSHLLITTAPSSSATKFPNFSTPSTANNHNHNNQVLNHIRSPNAISAGHSSNSSVTTAPLPIEDIYGSVCVFKPKSKKTRERGARNLEAKTAKRTSYIIGVFTVCWIPLFVVALLDIILYISIELEMLTLSIAILSAALNPIAYTVVNHTFRKEFFKQAKGCHMRVCNRTAVDD